MSHAKAQTDKSIPNRAARYLSADSSLFKYHTAASCVLLFASLLLHLHELQLAIDFLDLKDVDALIGGLEIAVLIV